MTPADREHYSTNGFVVLRGVVDPADLDALEGAFEHYAAEYLEDYGLFGGMHSADYAKALAELAPVEEEDIYKSMRGSQNLQVFAQLSELVEPAMELLDSRAVASKAIRFRMDQPHSTRHLAVWHQDHAYVGGSTDTVTAWVPLQDTPWEMGPLLIVPGSHYLAIKHIDGPMGRKVAWPLGGANTREQIIGMPMRRGDALLFHSLLLHSGQVNLSDRVRFSVQVRYEPL